jgi:autotransporter-associated beta strand protein
VIGVDRHFPQGLLSRWIDERPRVKSRIWNAAGKILFYTRNSAMTLFRFCFTAMFVVSCLTVAERLALAATKIWDGGSTVDSNINTAENWDLDTAYVLADDLTFTGTVRLDPTTIVGQISPRSITFDENAGAFVFGGTEELIINNNNNSGSGPKLINSSPVAQVFNTPVAVRRLTLTADTGDLVFNGTFRTFGVFCSYAGDADYYFNGGLLGPSQIFKTGAGTMYLPADSSARVATGTTSQTAANFVVQAGVAQISHNNSLGGGTSDGTQQYIQFSNGLTGAIGTIALTNKDPSGNVTGNITVGQYVYFYATDDPDVVHFSNLSGSNTLTGHFLDDGGGANSANHRISSDGTDMGDLLTLTGNIEKSFVDETHPAGILVFQGDGDGLMAGNIIESGTGQWGEVAKEGAGTWTFTGTNGYTGTTRVEDGIMVLGAAASIANSSQIEVKTNGTLDVSAHSTFTVGASTAQTLKGDGEITGNLTIASGSALAVDYSGSAIDSLTISGDFDISNATIDFNDVGGALTPGIHVIATYGTLIGTEFANVIEKPAGFILDYDYLGNSIALVAPLPGDFNADGNVDGDDFAIWQMNFPTQSSASLGTGDGDGDGDVDGADFVIWQTNYIASMASGATTIPEPMAIVMWGIGGIGLLVIGRRKMA